MLNHKESSGFLASSNTHLEQQLLTTNHGYTSVLHAECASS